MYNGYRYNELVCRGLSNMPEENQQWPARSNHHQSFIRRITQEYRALKGATGLAKDKALMEGGRVKIYSKLEPPTLLYVAGI